jgi:hypothetical protein
MANMIHYKYHTCLTSRTIRDFEHTLEAQIRITVFIDYIHDNTFLDSPILTDQLTKYLIPQITVIFKTAAVPHLSQKHFPRVM